MKNGLKSGPKIRLERFKIQKLPSGPGAFHPPQTVISFFYIISKIQPTILKALFVSDMKYLKILTRKRFTLSTAPWTTTFSTIIASGVLTQELNCIRNNSFKCLFRAGNDLNVLVKSLRASLSPTFKRRFCLRS